MRTKLSFLLCLLLLFNQAALAENGKTVFIFYYGWYANPFYDDEWLHWQEFNHNPPWDIASSFYPKLGSYSSADVAVLDQHMKWIESAGIDVLIYSWWGQDDLTDRNTRLVLDAASDHNLKLSFLIEPYLGRTTRSICEDIEYLHREFGNHPAIFRVSRPTEYGNNPRLRSMIFVYAPEYPDHELMMLADQIHDSEYDSILLLHSTDVSAVDRTHADGIFAYEAYQSLMHFYEGIAGAAVKKNVIFIPCVSPGFNINRTLGSRSQIFRPRRNGQTYDLWWEKVLISDTDFVSIISFNEWHEGTQIEPAIKAKLFPNSYLSYNDAFGKKGVPAEKSYLWRTRYWIHLFHQTNL